MKHLEIINFIKNIYGKKEIPLHRPLFIGDENKYLKDTIDSTFVSSVGKYVTQFENEISEFTKSKYAIATINGTAALHIALKLVGVKDKDEVITQPLTFIATANAISYLGAKPLFIDVGKDTLGLSPFKLYNFLKEHTYKDKKGNCINKITKNIIKACVPMHTLGHPCKIDEIVKICKNYNIEVIEDAAEALGSCYKDKHVGTFGKIGIISFNGNKIITAGNGGMLITDNEKLAKLAKHITTTAKIKHKWEYKHDYIGYNYRLSNLNAALGVAQLKNITYFIKQKRKITDRYKKFFKNTNIKFINEPEDCYSNYWLNGIIFETEKEKNEFLKISHQHKIFTRPLWHLISDLGIYKTCYKDNLSNSKYLQKRIVNLPSSALVT